MMLRYARELLMRLQAAPIRRYREIEGWLTPAEAVGLYHLARRLPAGARIVEIGSWKGKSTYCLAKGLKSGTVVAVDPFNAAGEEGSRYVGISGEIPLLQQFKDNLLRLQVLERVDIRVGRSADFTGQITDIDALFIDGDHSIDGCAYDFKTFSAEVKVNGFLAFHDYSPRRLELGPTWVVDNLVIPSHDWELIERKDSLILFRRVGGVAPA